MSNVRRFMSIEFGILREGSSITLIGENRVLLDEELLPELAELFKRIELHTGEELDTYGAGTFSGKALSKLIEEVQVALATQPKARPPVNEFLAELLRVAQTAERSNKALSYLGL
jgi:hypothetical protein